MEWFDLPLRQGLVHPEPSMGAWLTALDVQTTTLSRLFWSVLSQAVNNLPIPVCMGNTIWGSNSISD